MNGQVLPDDLVGLLFHLLEQFWCQFLVEINDNCVISHMESHIIATGTAVNDTADNVLPRVILHEGEAPVPIQCAGDLSPHLQGGIGQVDNIPSPLLGVGHMDAAQRPSVAGLAASFGIKSGLVQNHFVPFLLPRLAIQNGSLEGMATHIGVKNAFRHSVDSSLFLSYA